MIATVILDNTQWLYTKILENRIFFIDYWSFAHFWSGAVIFGFLSWRKFKRRWTVLVTLIVFYECFELAFIYFSLNVFKPETIKDQFTDIFIGLLGGLAARAFIYYFKPAINRQLFLHYFLPVFVSLTISFIWVGNYQYRYNIDSLNTSGLNWWAFSVWSVGIFLLIKFFLSIEPFFKHMLQSLLSTWVIYFAALLIIEYIGHYTLGIMEIGHPTGKALVWGVIHGTRTLDVFYLTVPFTSIILYRIFACPLHKK